MEDIVKIFETDKISFRRKEDRKKGFLFETELIECEKSHNYEDYQNATFRNGDDYPYYRG